MSTLFLSDLHLDDAHPETLEKLEGLLAGPARQADAVYLLGDLFEFWIGDDALSESARRVAAHTRALSEDGVPCYFQHGNRDFLLGESYAKQAGLQLLPEYQVLNLHGTPTVLLHGDTLCTDDVEYQAFRRQVRDPRWQAQVLALGVEERLQLARNARDASKAHTGTSAMDIMDANPQAVAECFEAHGVRRMIHGHTHRPATHEHPLSDGTTGRRIVLSDWYGDRASYLEVSAGGETTHAL